MTQDLRAIILHATTCAACGRWLTNAFRVVEEHMAETRVPKVPPGPPPHPTGQVP